MITSLQTCSHWQAGCLLSVSQRILHPLQVMENAQLQRLGNFGKIRSSIRKSSTYIYGHPVIAAVELFNSLAQQTGYLTEDNIPISKG